jgi:Zn-dependent protease with chaperone function
VLDNNAIDDWMRRAGARPALSLVHWLEQRWGYAIAALGAVAACSWAFIVYGVPVLAAVAMRNVPVSLDQQLGQGTLDALDRFYLKPSTLDADRKQELRKVFASVAKDQPDPANYLLAFRHGGAIGPNAFALPDGVVVLTDELAALAEDSDELRAVFAHEIGHVVHRHGMQTVLQTSAISALMFTLMGDAASVSSVVAAAPAALATAKYSRKLEIEADNDAFDYMRRHGLPDDVMMKLLTRIEKEGVISGSNLGYFRTHPLSAERIRTQ